jgi:hypothetical protein
MSNEPQTDGELYASEQYEPDPTENEGDMG